MAFKLLTIAFAATAAAAPTSSSPCQSAEFSLAMQVDGNYVSLNAIDNGSPGSVNIVAENPSEYPGTPVYENGTTPNAQLNFNIDCTNEPLTNQTGVFHISVPDLGERYGASEAITASTEFTYPHFSVGSDGSVVPELTAASQWWYACNKTIEGEDYVALSWGVYNNNGSAPWGCEITNVVQNFNVGCSN